MNAFINWLDLHFVPIAAKIGSQKHLVAIRDAFASLMPIVLVGAFAVLLNNVFFVPWSLLAGYIGEGHSFIVWAYANIAPLFDYLSAGTLSLISLYLVFAIGYQRASSENHDALSTAVIAASSFIVVGALGNADTGNYLDAKGMFIALIVGLIASGIYMKITDNGWVIKLPDSVPPAVGKGFSAVIPGAFAIGFWGIVAYCFSAFAGQTFFVWFQTTIANSLLGLSQGIGSVLIISFLVPFLWFFGLHGANLLEAVLNPIYGQLGLNNIEMFSNGVKTVGDGLSVWVRGSWDAYVYLGGSGGTIGLVLAILFFSKVKQDKEIAKLSLPTGIFMINEPVLFGLPVVLNPIYFIPFVLNQPILAGIAYVATSVGFAGPIVNQVPWTTPPVLNAFLSTNGSIGAVIIALVNIAVAFMIYLPFVYMGNKQEEKRLAAQVGVNE